MATEKHGNSIGFLRLALAGLVVLCHAYLLGNFGPDPLMRWSHGDVHFGKLAVQGFFVLSGSLVAASYERLRCLPRFLWHRALRLAPAYWTCLIVTAFLIGPFVYATSAEAGSYLTAAPSPWRYVGQNFFNPRSLIGIDRLFALNPWGTEINGSLWTLFYEAFCYLVVAALGLAGLLGRGRKWFLGGYLGLAMLYLLWAGAHPAWLPAQCNRLFNTEGKILVLFFLGGAAWTTGAKATTRWNRRPWLGLACASLLVLGAPLRFYPLVAPFTLAPVLFYLGDHLSLRSVEVRLGGDYSYGLYLYSYPVQQTLAHLGLYKLGLILFLFLSLAVSGALAFASWHCVEKHALRLKSFHPRLRSISLPPWFEFKSHDKG
ncbi:MAG TPA: acyltransferase [Opitutaceae bacterium]|nr:acyltransferase [Opitutaceae bacterium]